MFIHVLFRIDIQDEMSTRSEFNNCLALTIRVSYETTPHLFDKEVTVDIGEDAKVCVLEGDVHHPADPLSDGAFVCEDAHEDRHVVRGLVVRDEDSFVL